MSIEKAPDGGILFEGSSLPQALFVNGKLRLANQSFRKFFSWFDTTGRKAITLKDLFGKQYAKAILDHATGGSEPLKKDLQLKNPSGAEFHVEVTACSVPYDGKDALLCGVIDVTTRTNLLRQLEGSESRYRALIENAIDGASLAQDDKVVFVNTAFLRMFGYSGADEVLGSELDSLRKKSPEKPARGRTIANAITEYSTVNKKDRTALHIVARDVPLTIGARPAILTWYSDVTARRKEEEIIRNKVRMSGVLEEISASVHGSLHVNEVVDHALRVSMKGLGFEYGAMYMAGGEGKDVTMLMHRDLPEDVATTLHLQNLNEGLIGYVVKTLEPIALLTKDYPPHLPYKSLFAAAGIASIIYVPLTSQAKLVGIMMLATRKTRVLQPEETALLSLTGGHLGEAINNARSYAKVRDTEERYRSAIENISDVIYTAAPNGTLMFMSPTIERILGYSPGEVFKSPDLWRAVMHVDDRAVYGQRISNQALGVDNFHLEYRMLPRGKAAYRQIRDSIRYSRDEKGNVVAINGILSDITDLMGPGESIVQSEQLKTNVLESLKVGVAVYDTDFKYIDWNSAMHDITGIARDTVMNRSVFESTPELGGEEVRRLLEKALSGESVSSEDIVLNLPGGDHQNYIWIRYSPLRDERGTISGVVAIVTDVTNRRKLEREVRESEETLRNVIDAMGDALMISDLQGRVWEVNKEFSHITGFQRSEVLGVEFPYPWVLDEEMAKFVLWISELRGKNYLRDFDMTWRRKDGFEVAISLNTTLLRNALGDPVAMLNIGRDISDRKRLSLELERRNKEIELLNRIISKANTTMDFKEIFENIAVEIANLVPYDQINVALLAEDGQTMSSYACVSPAGILIPPGTTIETERTVSKLAIVKGGAVVLGNLRDHEALGPDTTSIEEGLQSQISIPIYLNERVLGTLNVASLKEQAFTGEDLNVLQPIADQIGAMIDRVRLFQKVSDDGKYIHNLLNSIDSVVYTVDRNYRITEVNKAWHDFALGQGRDKWSDGSMILGHTLEEVLPERYLGISYQQVMQDLFRRKTDYYSQEFDFLVDGKEKTYHLVISPMIINDVVTGLVFTNTDVTDIKRTEAEIKRRNKELVALNAISTSISKSLKLEEVLRVATDQIRDIFGADIVLFYLRNERKNQLVLAHQIGMSDQFAARIRLLDAATSATGSVITRQQPLHIKRNLSIDDRVTSEGRSIFAELHINSLSAIPLLAKDKVLGAMDVGFSHDHEFNEQEQQLLILIGNQLGAAIENAQLYEEVQAQVQRITSLYELGKGLTGALDTRTLLEIVSDEVRKTFPVDAFSYQMFSDEKHCLIPLFEIAGGKQTFFNSGVKGRETLVEPDSLFWDVVTKGVVYVNNALSGTGSMLAVPIKSKEVVIGILSIERSVPDAYTDSHLRLLESIANLTSIAIDKAMLYEDTVNKSREIEYRNRELDDFTYVVSHDLKEPLISIEGYSKIILKDYKEIIDDEGKEYINAVVQSTSRMKSLIDDLLTLSRLGRVSEVQENIPVGELVKDILYELQFTLREKQVDVRVSSELPDVLYNRTQLNMVFRNLISNALKFNNKPHPTIRIDAEDSGQHHTISIADNGIGIEKQYYDRIFMIFQRLQRSEEFRGTGAGLTIVKKIVERHHGRVWVESVLGEGTTFFFTIPK